MTASRVTVYDVGPRDGLQNEPEILDVATRVELVRKLVGAGVPAIEVASFVDPRRVPQMAHAEEVVEAVGRSAGRRARWARAQRARLRAARRDRARRGAVRLRCHRVVQRTEPGRVRRGVDHGGRSHRVSCARGRAPLDRDAERRVRLPVRGRGRSRAGARSCRPHRREQPRRSRPRGHHRRRGAGSGSRAHRARRGARHPGRGSLPQHAKHRLCERARGTRRGCHRARCVGRRPRRLSLRAERDGKHRDGGSRLRARSRRRRDGNRPRAP